jgi:hypothetical protein
MPLDPQTIARAIVEERNKGAEMSENLERLLEMYKVCITSSVLLCHELPVSLDCPFLIAPLVFSNVYL